MDEEKFEDLSMEEAGEQLDEDEFQEYCQWKEDQLHKQKEENISASAARRSEMAQKFIKAGGEHKIAEITIILDEDDEFDLKVDLSKIDELIPKMADLKDKGYDNDNIDPEQLGEMKGEVVDLTSELVINKWADKQMWSDFAEENGTFVLKDVVDQVFATIQEDFRSIQKFQQK